MLNGMNKLLKQAQEMQQKMKEMQAQMEQTTYQSSAGGDMVTVTINGKMELVKLNLAKEVVNPEDIDMLQDLIVSAVNAAVRKVAEETKNNMQQFTGGLNIPGLNF